MSQEDLAEIPDSNKEGNHGEKTPVVCPACGSKLTRRSMRRSWQDRFKSLLGIWPYRCEMCSARFTCHLSEEAIARHNANAEEAMHKRGGSHKKDDLAIDEIGDEWSIRSPNVAPEEPKH